jgi:hypothetical protein
LRRHRPRGQARGAQRKLPSLHDVVSKGLT